jgi:hypothetical protein
VKTLVVIRDFTAVPCSVSLALCSVELRQPPKAVLVASFLPRPCPVDPLASYQIKPTPVWEASALLIRGLSAHFRG